MIRDGYITYPGAHSVFNVWQPQDVFLYEVLISLFATALLYQISGIVFDVMLGRHKCGTVLVSDLGEYILVSDYNLQLVFGNLRRVLQNSEPKQVTDLEFAETRELPLLEEVERRSKASVLARLFLLLLTPFLGRILAVLLTLEQDRVVSFADVDFRPMKVGIAKEQVETFGLFPCKAVKTNFGPGDVALAKFSICKQRLQPFSISGNNNWNDKGENYSLAYFSLRLEGELRLSMRTQTLGMDEFVYADVSSAGEAFHLDVAISEDEARSVFTRALNKMTEGCPPSNSYELFMTHPADIDSGLWDMYARMDCRKFIDRDLETASRDVFQNITLVNSQDFGVLTGQNQTLHDSVEHLPLLKSRGSGVSFLGILVTTLCVMILRLGLKLVTNNDVHIGLDAVVKNAIAVKSWDSLLRCQRTVFYSEKNIRVEKSIVSNNSGPWNEKHIDEYVTENEVTDESWGEGNPKAGEMVV